MVTLSDRIRNLLFSLALCSAIIAIAGAGFASESAEGGHHVDTAAQMKDFCWRMLNFAVLAGILGWAIAKAKVKNALAERQAQIEKHLREAQQAREVAEQKLREYSSKLEQASREIDELHAAIVREGEQEKQRIIAEAHKAAAKIADQAALSAELEVHKARLALQTEAGRLAVELASGKLAGAIRKDDHDRYVGEYLEKVGQLQ
jgi:F-type H+-transporting ATPase subunit b